MDYCIYEKDDIFCGTREEPKINKQPEKQDRYTNQIDISIDLYDSIMKRPRGQGCFL